jgi:hypothetical protein
VEKLKGKYLLIHGTADDNVHYQNSRRNDLAMVKANKPFEQFAYPDRNHGIYGGTTRLHLFELMTDGGWWRIYKNQEHGQVTLVRLPVRLPLPCTCTCPCSCS